MSPSTSHPPLFRTLFLTLAFWQLGADGLEAVLAVAVVAFVIDVALGAWRWRSERRGVTAGEEATTAGPH